MVRLHLGCVVVHEHHLALAEDVVVIVIVVMVMVAVGVGSVVVILVVAVGRLRVFGVVIRLAGPARRLGTILGVGTTAGARRLRHAKAEGRAFVARLAEIEDVGPAELPEARFVAIATDPVSEAEIERAGPEDPHRTPDAYLLPSSSRHA